MQFVAEGQKSVFPININHSSKIAALRTVWVKCHPWLKNMYNLVILSFHF